MQTVFCSTKFGLQIVTEVPLWGILTCGSKLCHTAMSAVTLAEGDCPLGLPKCVDLTSDSSKKLWSRCDKCGVILQKKVIKKLVVVI